MATSEKIDLYRLHKADYAAPRKPAVVEIARATYLTVPGHGAPGGEAFQARIGALYGVAFTVKMTRKFEGLEDYTVCKLEAQWWGKGGDGDLHDIPQDEWNWKLLIRTPDFIKKKDITDAVAKLVDKGKGAHADEVALEKIGEGRCVQMLHVGPYDREHETVALMLQFAEEKGYAFHGAHHEIYLSDPRRVAPEKLKTILRRPVLCHPL